MGGFEARKLSQAAVFVTRHVLCFVLYMRLYGPCGACGGICTGQRVKVEQ